MDICKIILQIFHTLLFYAHDLFGFVLILFCYLFMLLHTINLPISFRVDSVALGQSYDCPSATEVTLKSIGNIKPLPKHIKMW